MKRRKNIHPLQRRRLALGMTVEEFAKRVGASEPTVSAWETGKVKPFPAAFPRIAEVLGISPLEAVDLLLPTNPRRSEDAADPDSTEAGARQPESPAAV